MSKFHLPSTGLALLLLTSPAWASEHHSTVDTRLPEGFELRLRPDNQSIGKWHALQEGRHALVLGGTVVGSWLLNKALSPYLPMHWLMPAAGVALDVSTSKDWYDFAARQAFKLPLAAIFPYEYMGSSASYVRPIVENLFVEAPLLVMGAREYVQQQASVYSGQNMLIPGTAFDRHNIHIAFSTGSEYPFLLFIPQKPQIGDEHAIHPQLSELSHTASTLEVRTIALKPLADNNNRSIEVIFLRGQEQVHVVIQLPGRFEEPWLNDLLALNEPKPQANAVLSPFTPCLLAELNTLIAENTPSGTVYPSDCRDMSVPTVTTDRLQMISLGGPQGYLLIDHGRTQGSDMPDIWLNSLAQTSELSEEWLATIDQRLAPGEERGAWRILSALRSAGYRMVAHYGIDWLTRPPHNQPPINNSTPPDQTQPAVPAGAALPPRSAPPAPPPPPPPPGAKSAAPPQNRNLGNREPNRRAPHNL